MFKQGGAKNHLVAAPDCLVSLTSTDVVNSFTGCAGQRCMAASVLLVVGDQPLLIQEIVKKASLITPGSGSGEMGPVIDQHSKSKIESYIDQAVKDGAQILLDGRVWSSSSSGFWIGPTVILHKNKTDSCLHDEIFGPVLSILQVETRDEAIEIENANPYGNAACIYTQSGASSEWYLERFSAGMLGVNIGVPVPREPFSFGGINKSSFGDCDITGSGGINFFTKRIKVTTKWVAPVEQGWMS